VRAAFDTGVANRKESAMGIARKWATEAGTTRPIRWGEICRAARVLGVMQNYSKAECLRIAKVVAEQVKAGKVLKDSRGVYRAKLTKEDIKDLSPLIEPGD
jgi:hypothetical protein